MQTRAQILAEARALVAESEHWIKSAIKHPGALHRQLGVKQSKKIPKNKLRAAAKKSGKLGRRARLAITLSKMSEDSDKTIDQEVRDKLREVVSGAKHRYKATSAEDLADDIEVILRRANLSHPPILSKKQYDAVAEVWEALGDDLGEVEMLASRALMRLSEEKT